MKAPRMTELQPVGVHKTLLDADHVMPVTTEKGRCESRQHTQPHPFCFGGSCLIRVAVMEAAVSESFTSKEQRDRDAGVFLLPCSGRIPAPQATG